MGAGAGVGLAKHLKKYRAQRKEWKSGRADPPIEPKSKKFWDILRKPSPPISPHMLRRVLGGAAIGYMGGRTLKRLVQGIRKRRKKRK